MAPWSRSERTTWLPQKPAALLPKPLNPVQGACGTSKGFGLDPQALQDGNKEACQGELFRFYSPVPAGVGNDTGVGLVVFIALAKLEIAAILEAKIFTTRGNNRIVAREVETTGSRTMHGKGVIQHVAVAIGFLRIFQFLCETSKFLGLVAVSYTHLTLPTILLV